MCESNQYTWVYPDGRRKKQPLETVYLCPNARHGRPCAENTTYRHPARPAPSYSTSAPSPSPSPSSSPAFLSSTQFPPTPTYTPRSGTPNHYSGNDSDRSHHSPGRSGAAPRRTRSHRTPRVYINGQEVYSASSPSHSRERYVLSSSGNAAPQPQQASPRTHAPYSAPSSPPTPYVLETSSRPRRVSSAAQRPVIVHERPRVEIDIREPRRMHTRNPSSSSEDYSSSSSSRRGRQSRKERTAERIAQANAQIASRPPIPRASSAYRESEDQHHLADAMRRVDLNKEETRERRRLAKQQEKEQQAAQQADRLRERFSRRATVQYGGEEWYR